MSLLLPKQVTALEHIKAIHEDYPGAILRMDTGTGKTRIAAKLAEDYEKVLWVGKASTLKDVQKKINSYSLMVDITFISYTKFGNPKKFKNVHDFDLVVFDEAHTMRKWTSYGTQRMTRLTKFEGEMLFMTATPCYNSPIDSIYVLRKCGVFDDYKKLGDVYKRFFDSKPSKFSDHGWDHGVFQNTEDFSSRVDLVTVDRTKKDLDRDMPDPCYELVEVPGEYKPPKNITEETSTRIKYGLQKVPFVADHIAEKDIGIGLVLTFFHDTAKKMHEELEAKGVKTHLALTTAKVSKLIDQVAEEGGLIVTTLGLTEGSLDFNACNDVFLVESTYSAMKDHQSITRCHRLGKREVLNATYYAYEAERPFVKSLGRGKLNNLSEMTYFPPSKLELLEQCPGSFWMPNRLVTWVEKYSFKGSQAHAAVERYLNNPDAELPEYLSDNVLGALDILRPIVKEDNEKVGIEDRAKVDIGAHRVSGIIDFWRYKDGELLVIDFKNGKKEVEVENNIQLLVYSLMISSTYGISPEDIKSVRIGIVQNSKLNEKTYKSDIIDLTRDRVDSIIERVMDARDRPKDHLNEGDCSPFCNAYEYHQENKKNKKKKEKVMALRTTKRKSNKKRTTYTVQGEVIYSDVSEGTAIIKDKRKTCDIIKLGVILDADTIPKAKIAKEFSKDKLKVVGKSFLDPREDEERDNTGKKVVFMSNPVPYIKAKSDTDVDVGDTVSVGFQITVSPKNDKYDERAWFNIKEIDLLKKGERDTSDVSDDDGPEEAPEADSDDWLS